LNNLIGVSKLILHALEKILNTEINKTHDASRLRSLTYVLIGKLSYRVPKLFSDDIRLIQQFFEALKTEDNECCLNIQEALRYVNKYQTNNSSVESGWVICNICRVRYRSNRKKPSRFFGETIRRLIKD